MSGHSQRVSPGRLALAGKMLSLLASYPSIRRSQLEQILGDTGVLGGASPWREAIELVLAARLAVQGSDSAIRLSATGAATLQTGDEVASGRQILGGVIRNARPDLLCLAFMNPPAIRAFVDYDTVQCLEELGLLDAESEGRAEWWSELAGDARNEDQEYLKRLGDLAEEHSVAFERRRLRASGYDGLSEEVQWVSRLNEGLGFDVLSFAGRDLPGWPPEQSIFVEVKGCDRPPGQLRFFLTRNEWETACSSPDTWLIHFWRSVDLRADEGRKPYLILSASRIAPHVPTDSSPAGSWTVCEIALDELMLATANE